MSRYNTGNPIDSNNAKDLDDNAKNVDQFTNSEQDTWVDRFGKTRATITGIQNNALSKSKVSAEVSLASDQRVVTIDGFNASLSTYYIDGIRLSHPSHYTYADITTETITLDESAPSGSIIVATALDPTGTGVVASVDQLASLSAAELSSGLIEGQEYSIVDVGARFVVYPSGTPTLTGDIVNSSGQVLQLQPLDDGSWSVTHFIPTNASGDLNQYFSDASSRASGNSFTVTVPNTRDYQMDDSTDLTPAANWIIGGAVTFDGLPTVAPNNLTDYSIFTGKVTHLLSSGRATMRYMGDGARTYQKSSNRNGSPGCFSAAAIDGGSAISGVSATSLNESSTPDQSCNGGAFKAVNDNLTTGHSVWGLYEEALHKDGASGNTFGTEIAIANDGTTCMEINPYSTFDLDQQMLIANASSVGFGDYTGPISCAYSFGRASAGAIAKKGFVFQQLSVEEGSRLAEAYVLPSNYGTSWYRADGEMMAFIKATSNVSDVNEVRIGVFSDDLLESRAAIFQYNAMFLGTTSGVMDIGSPSLRVKDIYLVNSPDVSSDETQKEQQADLTQDEMNAALAIARLPKMFKWIAESQEKEGTDKTIYLHCSPMAQSVWSAMEVNNLDPTKYGFISNENGAWSIKPQELLWMICAAQQNKIDNFESRLQTLETN